MSTADRPRRAALYARVSTGEQEPENQLVPLRAFTTARGWQVTEYVDLGVSGSRERRPGLDALLSAVRTRKVDVVVIVKLDRLARSTHHLLSMAKEFESLGVDLVAIDQAVDTTTPAGRLLFHMLGAIAEFERDLIRERVIAGVRRARVSGKHLGRPRIHYVDTAQVLALRAEGRSWRATARALGVHPMAVRRAIESLSKTPTAAA
jgi:DNA invertase Pin-like site-specific DNA recombinase